MYLVGDRVNFPSPHGGNESGQISLIEEHLDNSISYVINSDDGHIIIRNSEDDDEMSLVNNIELDFS